MTAQLTGMLAEFQRSEATSDLLRRARVLADWIEENTGPDGGQHATLLRAAKPLEGPTRDMNVIHFLGRQVLPEAGEAVVAGRQIRPISSMRLHYVDEWRTWREHICGSELRREGRYTSLSEDLRNQLLRRTDIELQHYHYRYESPLEKLWLPPSRYIDLEREATYNLPGDWPSRHRDQEFLVGQCPTCLLVVWSWAQWPDVQSETYKAHIMGILRQAVGSPEEYNRRLLDAR